MNFMPDIRHYLLLVVFLLLPPAVKAEPQQKHRTGKFTAVFTERSVLSSPAAIKKRMRLPASRTNKDTDYQLANESFGLYVPEAYDSNNPSGLIVWVSPSEKGNVPEAWIPVLEKHKFVWVGANKSGNAHDYIHRRIPLALDAAHNAQKLYNIDPNRVYIAGLSGGGRVSSVTAFHHSDIYTGGIFIIGTNYWRQVKIPGRNAIWRRNAPRPRQKYLSHACRFGRYVFLTGDKDGNRLQTHNYYHQGYKKILKNHLYIQVPKMGHVRPPAEWFEKAIEFVDKPLTQDPNETPTSTP
jgi:hypothetical protein